uniref:GH16 domain-containing protein n=1 Tax=Panagrolaimus superbus TaxID=310955 RepID=A0A914Y9T5_9BILA
MQSSRSHQKLVWEDNFDRGSIDRSKFTFETGRGDNGWGNAELQHYTDRPENARIENNHLVIEARRENYKGSAFTSARIVTKGLMEFKYGTLEARIKLPSQKKGLWPAFWLLGANIGQVGWPNCGEIDILETGSADAIANNVVNNQVGGATHWENKAMYNTVHRADFDLSANFHNYKLTWTDAVISVSLDDKEYFRMNIPTQTFKKPHYVIFNLAVGGNHPNIHDPNQIDANFPAQMQIDYIKLFQNDGDELRLKN